MIVVMTQYSMSEYSGIDSDRDKERERESIKIQM